MKFSKKLMAMALAGMVLFTGCGSTQKQETSTAKPNKKIVVGINQIAEHSALDAAREGFEEELKNLGVDAEFIEENAQGDIANANLISQKFVEKKVDLIFAIGTPSAQASKNATKDILIVFSAVTDPVKAELVNASRFENINGKNEDTGKTIEDKNITGTTDATPIKKQLEIFKTVKSDAKNIGIVFNIAEVNSAIQVEQATAIAKELGMNVVPKGITNINEMVQAVDSLVGKVDGIYTITDNLVANGIKTVADKANSNKILTVGAERAHVEGGILVTDGISYNELGKQSARMVKEIIDGKDISTMKVENATETEQVINEDTAKLLGVDTKIFEKAEKIKTK